MEKETITSLAVLLCLCVSCTCGKKVLGKPVCGEEQQYIGVDGQSNGCIISLCTLRAVLHAAVSYGRCVITGKAGLQLLLFSGEAMHHSAR